MNLTTKLPKKLKNGKRNYLKNVILNIYFFNYLLKQSYRKHKFITSYSSSAFGILGSVLPVTFIILGLV